jgi:hypothetical protein
VLVALRRSNEEERVSTSENSVGLENNFGLLGHGGASP